MTVRGTGRIAAVCLTMGVIGAAPSAIADGKDWSLDLTAGVKFDDRVTVEDDEDGVPIGAVSDDAAVFELDANYRLVSEGDTRVDIGYDFYQSLYSDLSLFDWQQHSPKISVSTKFGGVRVGLAYGYTHASLGDAFYYGQHGVTPSMSVDLSDDIMLAMSYRYYDKNYNVADNARDVTGHQPNADVYFYFTENRRGFVTAGVGYTDEDARGEIVIVPVLPGPVLTPVPTDEYSYSGLLARVGVQVPVDPFGLPGRVRLTYSYQERDYDDPTSLVVTVPPGVATRRDDRHTLRAFGEVEIAESLKFFADYRYSDRESNLASSDYHKTVVSFGLEYGF